MKILFFLVFALASFCFANFCSQGLISPLRNPDGVIVYTDANATRFSIVTGAESYSLNQREPDIEVSKALLVKNLGLSSFNLKKYSGKQVLLVGEGFGATLPLFLEAGANVRAIDLWYNDATFPDNRDGRLMQKFVRENRAHLIAGDALELPIPDGSVEFYISEFMVRSMEEKEIGLAVKEAIRVLKPGGEAQFIGFNERMAPYLNNNLSVFLKRNKIRVEISTYNVGPASFNIKEMRLKFIKPS